MLVIVRADQQSVVSSLLPVPGRGRLGPTSSSGWTSAWLDEEGASKVRDLGDLVVISEDDTGLVVRVVTKQGAHQASLPGDVPECLAVEDVAVELSRLFKAPDRGDDVLRALEEAFGSDEALAEDLAAILEFPSIWEEAPQRSAVAYRGDPRSARLAGRLVGSTQLTLVDSGWSVLTDAEDPGEYLTLAMAAAAAGPKRRSVVLGLWRGKGAAAGFVLVHGSVVVAGATWNTGWHFVELSGTDEADESARILAEHLAVSSVNIVALRSLLRAADWHSDPLAQLAALLDLPSDVIAVLDAPEGLPSTQRLERLSLVRAWWEVTWAGAGGEPVSPRWLRVHLELLGADHPGIVAEVSAALATRQVSIEELSTDVREAPMSGGTLFEARAVLKARRQPAPTRCGQCSRGSPTS